MRDKVMEAVDSGLHERERGLIRRGLGREFVLEIKEQKSHCIKYRKVSTVTLLMLDTETSL